LQNRFRITVVDNRGVGQSSLPDGEFGVVDMAADAAALLDHLDIARTHIAGFSMGGAIAQELALARPDLVRSLVLVDSFAGADRYLKAVMESFIWIAGIADSEVAFANSLLPWIYAPALYDDGRIDEIVAAMLANPHPQDVEAFRRTTRACLGHDTRDRLAHVAAPTLVVFGELDILLPPRFSQELAAGIPGARLVALPGRAHQPFQEAPEEFNAIVTAFSDDAAQSTDTAIAVPRLPAL
jgi:pimeloyl-ACP methyl ester carboxylesterase